MSQAKDEMGKGKDALERKLTYSPSQDLILASLGKLLDLSL